MLILFLNVDQLFSLLSAKQTLPILTQGCNSVVLMPCRTEGPLEEAAVRGNEEVSDS